MFFLYALGFLFVSLLVGFVSFVFFQWFFFGFPYPSIMGGIYWKEDGRKSFFPPNRLKHRFVSVELCDQFGWLLKKKYWRISLVFASMIGISTFVYFLLEV